MVKAMSPNNLEEKQTYYLFDICVVMRLQVCGFQPQEKLTLNIRYYQSERSLIRAFLHDCLLLT